MTFNKFHAYLLSIVLITPISSSFPQLSAKLNLESGYYNSTQHDSIKQNDVIYRLNGLAKYRYAEEKRSASIQLRVSPESFGGADGLFVIKMKAEGNYFQKENNFNWGLDIARQKNIFKQTELKLNYDIFLVNGNLNLFLIDNFSISSSLGYAFQNASKDVNQNLDLFFLDLKAVSNYNLYCNIGYGFYIERFNVKSNLELQPNSLNIFDNSGWRFGPQISFNYLKNILANVDYRFLFHNSKLTGNPSYEQWIRVLAGTFITEKLSAFLLVDYYWRKFKQNETQQNYTNLYYNPLNIENNIYAKLAYEINESFESYIKSGYFKYDVVSRNYSIAGWDIMLGVEIKVE